MVNKGKNRAIDTLDKLHDTLEAFAKRDPDQIVMGAAVISVDAAISDARTYVDADDPVVNRIAEVMSPEAVAAGDAIRCSDLLVVVDILRGRLGPPEIEVVIA